jgi:hypothetical protein
MDLYTASVLDLEIVGCLFVLHAIRLGSKNIAKPPVDHLSSLGSKNIAKPPIDHLSSIEPTQSVSEKALIGLVLDFLNVKP